MEAGEAVAVEAAPAKKKRERGRHGFGHVYVHRQNWMLDVRIHGVRHRIKLGLAKFMERKDAIEERDRKLKELLAPKPEPVKGDMPFRDFAAKFAAWAVETKLCWAHYHGKRLEKTPLRHAVEFFAGTPLKDVSKDRIKDFALRVRQLRIGGRPVKNRTANGYVKDLRHVLNKAIEWGDADSNPVSKFKFLDEQRQKSPARIIESSGEQDRLLAALPTWMRLMVEFDLQTGARRGDLLNLTWRSVHPSHVEFCETKECRHRMVPLSYHAGRILEILRPPNAHPNAFVFEPLVSRKTLKERMRAAWRRAIEESGIPKLRIHDLRHTVGSRLVRDGVDLRTVMSILGHSKLQTTERYLHSCDKLKQEAVDKLSGYGHSLPPASPEIPASDTIN